MPDRIITPRRASYLMILMALAIIALAVWNINLNGRVNTQEEIRRVADKAAKARAASECRARIAGTKQANNLLAAMRDLAEIPQVNIRTYLADPLPPLVRANYEDALRRYMNAEKRFHPFPLPSCVRTDP